jgi:hypothetical protein
MAQYSNQALSTNWALVFYLASSRYLVVSNAAIMWKQSKRKPALDLPLQCLWAKWSIPRQLGTQRARQHPIVGKIDARGTWCVASESSVLRWYTGAPQFWLGCYGNPWMCLYSKRVSAGFRNLCLFSFILCSQQSFLSVSVRPSVIYSSECNDGPPLRC